MLPGTAAQVRGVVRACYEAGVPFVARGAGTGLSGGALPVGEGILIVLARMRRILAVNLDDATVEVEPGVTNLAISRAVAPTHFYPPDPSSQIVCSIGGNIAENSGGAHCFKYGFTTNYVTGLEVVLSDGTVVELDRDAPGYDLLGAFVGSEGTLGVATRIRLRVIPAPESVRTAASRSSRTRSAAGDAVTAIVAAGIVPGAIEMMDRLSIAAAEQATGAGYRLDAGAALLVELDGPREECTARLRAPDGAVRAGGRAGRAGRAERAGAGADVADPQGRLRGDGADRAGLLRAGRCDPQDAARRGARAGSTRSPPSTGCRSRTSSTPATATCTRSSATTPAREGEAARAEELAGMIIKACVDADGSITGEHGVGRRQEGLHAGDVRRERPRDVSAAALRVRSRRARESRQGDADARGCAARSPAPTASTRSSATASPTRF